MASNPPQALRVTFGYQGSQIRVLGSERVAMLVPAPAGDPPAAGQTGYWLAVRDAAGRVTYHQPLQDPLRTSVEVFGPLPTCRFGTQPNLSLATNYQDLWWRAPAGSESGWGLNITHQGDTLFLTWFTYDIDGSPLWLSATARRTAAATYGGTLYRTTGPAFSANPWNPAAVTRTQVGSVTLTFADRNSATFAYIVNGISRTKPIIRQVFREPGTVCV